MKICQYPQKIGGNQHKKSKIRIPQSSHKTHKQCYRASLGKTVIDKRVKKRNGELDIKNHSSQDYQMEVKNFQ